MELDPKLRILNDVAQKHRLDVSVLTGFSRLTEHVAARHELFYELRSQLKLSFPKIGKFVNKDHTTIIHGVRKHEKKLHPPI